MWIAQAWIGHWPRTKRWPFSTRTRCVSVLATRTCRPLKHGAARTERMEPWFAERSAWAEMARSGADQHVVRTAACIAGRCLPSGVVGLASSGRRIGRGRTAEVPAHGAYQHVVGAAISVTRGSLPCRIVTLPSSRRRSGWRVHNTGYTAVVAGCWRHAVLQPATLGGTLNVPVDKGPSHTLSIIQTGGLASNRAATDVKIMVVAARPVEFGS